MSPHTMNYIYFVSIALFGLVMFLSPRTFMGKAKFDESAIKTEGLLKKVAIAIIILQVILILINALK